MADDQVLTRENALLPELTIQVLCALTDAVGSPTKLSGLQPEISA